MVHIRHRFMTNVRVYQSSIISYHMGHIHRNAYRVCPWLTSWHGNASASLTLCERFLQKQRDIPHKGSSNPRLGCFFAVSLNKLLKNKTNKQTNKQKQGTKQNKQSRYLWFGTPWRSCEVIVMSLVGTHLNEEAKQNYCCVNLFLQSVMMQLHL